MDIKKVHEGLGHVDRKHLYHMGYFNVDFQDGALTFQLHARICSDTSCLCDNLQLDWVAQNSVYQTWYTSEREWHDLNHQPIHPDMEGVFRIVEQTELFQERYMHLVYLRRKMVLQEVQRLRDSFDVYLPEQVLGEGADLEKGIMGRVEHSSKDPKGEPYTVEFCGDPECYCGKLFLVLPERNPPLSFCIEQDGEWSSVDDLPASKKMMNKLRSKLKTVTSFQNLLLHLKQERQLHNYHRFVKHFEETTARKKTS